MSRLPELIVVAIATAAIVPVRHAEACGPDFAPELLSRREAVLLDLPDGVFLDEAAALVPPPSRRYVVAARPVAGDGWFERELYGRGARAFHAGDLAAAERAFEDVLALPAPWRRHRSTFAAYMLGRLRSGDAAIAAYRRVRALAEAGFADDAALAVSSLGQEARLHLGAGDTAAAVRLYATQAAHGDEEGGISLLFVVRETIAGGGERALLADEVGQRLLAAYLYARSDELDEAPRARVLRALTAIDRVAGADRLAAAAYREGDWALAARLIARADDTHLARRVRAKLALRDGDTATAARLLRDADDGTIARVHGERAALALVEGRVTDAMALAWDVRATYPEDALFLAERVLTIDELTAFVDRLPPAGAATDEDAWWTVTTPAMRAVLARRLMRAGRHDEAVPYFEPLLRLPALVYGDAMARARWTGDPIERARALYQASRIARRDGLELLGTALAPDWGFYDAQYDLSEYRGWTAPGRWTTAGEQARVADSAPPSMRRYHYRVTASALAEQAADLLPERSQAFAATLCWSARHIASRDPARLEALYGRYLDDGPAVSMNFGYECPAPELERARRFLERPAGPLPRWPLAVVIALCALAGVLLARHLRADRVVVRP